MQSGEFLLAAVAGQSAPPPLFALRGPCRQGGGVLEGHFLHKVAKRSAESPSKDGSAWLPLVSDASLQGWAGKAPLEWAGGGVTLSSPKAWTRPPSSRDWRGGGELICPQALLIGAVCPGSS